jgi:hypothetical protein
MRQVAEHTGSQRRQYALAESARTVGFASVTVIDDDLGRSGSELVERPGFQKLVASVCSGAIGAVFCIEASRLARNGRDWHHPIDLCALVGTLVIDPDGTYDPRLVNDRRHPGPVEVIRKLGGQSPDREVAVTMNRMRYKPSDGNAWTTVRVRELPGTARNRTVRSDVTACGDDQRRRGSDPAGHLRRLGAEAHPRGRACRSAAHAFDGSRAYEAVVREALERATALLPPGAGFEGAQGVAGAARGLVVSCAEHGFAGAFSRQLLDTLGLVPQECCL